MINYGRQNINEADIQAVTAVLRSDFLTQGPAIEQFKRKRAWYCGVNVGFVDIDNVFYNISIQKLERRLAITTVTPESMYLR